MTPKRPPRTLDEAYRFACLALLVCRFAYYVRAFEVVTDAQYDEWEDILRRFEETHPAKIHPDSPTLWPGSDSEATYPSSIVRAFPGPVAINVHAYQEFFDDFEKLTDEAPTA